MIFPRLAKKQSIRLTNTLLAAIGGGILSFCMLFAFLNNDLHIGPRTFYVLQTAFWAVNCFFIGAIISGFNLRFRDPAMSLAQMYWAVSTTLAALLLTPHFDATIYVLALLVMVFGVFRVSLSQFNVFCLYVIAFTVFMHVLRQWVLQMDMPVENSSPLNGWVQASVFCFCALAMTQLCKSIVTLRLRLRQQNDSLKEALAAKSTFLANMSHEIRTPMNGVLGMLDIVLKSPLGSTQERHLRTAQSSAHSLLTVLNDILDFSKLEAGKLTINPVDFDLKQMLKEVLHSFLLRAKENDVELILDYPSSLGRRIHGDPVRIRQVLNNVIGNAVKFTHQGEVEVQIDLQKSDDKNETLLLRIRDTGIGIEPHRIPELFEAFTQADDSTTRVYGGTGLGLPITKQLAEMMGGEIHVFSELGKGSRFDIRLQVEAAEGAHDSSPLKSFEGKRILVADLCPSVRRIIRSYLESVNAQVVEADNVRGVLNLLSVNIQDRAWDALLLDSKIIDQQGLDLIQDIRGLSQGAGLPLIVLVNIFTEYELRQYETQIVQGFVDKPVMVDELGEVLSVILNSRRTSEPAKAAYSYFHHEVNKMREPEEQDKPLLGQRILLVEDNKINQDVAEVVLEEFGCTVEMAWNGAEAISMLEQRQAQDRNYDAILMDCQMPVMDGYTATRKIREHKGLRCATSIPIIAMTANAMKGDREKCLDSGMNDFISKPINVDLLEETLKKYVLGPEAVEKTEARTIGQDEKPAGSDNQDIVVWDKDALARLVRNKPERMEKLVRHFLIDLMHFKKDIGETLEKEAWEQAQADIHALKGSSSNLGARELPSFLDDLRQDITLKKTQEAKNKIPELFENIERLQAEMQGFLNSV